jgi:hypothetical protein
MGESGDHQTAFDHRESWSCMNDSKRKCRVESTEELNFPWVQLVQEEMPLASKAWMTMYHYGSCWEE